ncbi:MAG: primosomal protein N' [Oscillospiraceae bacterium]|nr:primosomal protein N' [Oscillospiraceae bacterium]
MEKLIAKVAVSAATYQIDKPYDYIVPEELAAQLSPGMRVLVPFSKGNRKSEGIVLSLTHSNKCEKLKCVFSSLDETPAVSDELIRLALWMRERFFCTVYDAVKAMLPAGLWYNLSAVCRIAEGVGKDEAYEKAERSDRQRRVLDVIYANGGKSEYRAIELAFGGEDPASAVKALASKSVIVTDSIQTRKIKDKTVSYAYLAVPSETAAEIATVKRRSAPSQAAVLELLVNFGGATVNDIRYLTGAGPGVVKRLEQDGLVSIEQMEVFRRPEYREGASLDLPELISQQKVAYDGILALMSQEKAACALLYGVTGSGKTSVYVRLIDELLKREKSSILLVPEIALTPQMLETFSSYFGDKIAVMHSSLAAGERYDEWKRVKNGNARVVVGTRSAVFAPVKDLGLIIIDEEQEDTYKSENAPRYHARDVAKFRCARNGALLLLGSATPDIVSRYNAQIGKYSFFTLPARYNQMSLPQVRIVDMKKELRNGNGGNFSSVLIEELKENISRKEQSILFLNRRGMFKLISCTECGYTYKCPNCSVSLTYHSANNRLMCHYCGYTQKTDTYCPDCGGKLNFVGAGTQKIEEELVEFFPGIGLIRLDTDTVAAAGSHDVLLNKFREENVPILLGTQMVTKGLDFPNVTLVGVLLADQSLYSGDYRASERTFSLITQVVGRSGRGDSPGRAVIQTFTPRNQVILQAANQDYDGFYASELEMRRLQWSPPFSELFSLTAVGQSESTVMHCLNFAKRILAEELGARADVRLLGPAPLSVVRVNNSFRYRLTIACKDERQIRELLSNVIIYCNTNKEYKGVTLFGDIGANQ